MTELKYHEIMAAEQHPDCYSGDTCDQIRPDWHGWGEGDKDGPGSVGDVIQLAASTFPAGTRISVTVPICPECEEHADLAIDGKCDCGFDWEQWARDQYS